MYICILFIFTDTRITRLVTWFEPRGWPSKIVNCLPNAKLYRGLVLPWCYLPGERARRNLELVVLERQRDRQRDRQRKTERDRERGREREIVRSLNEKDLITRNVSNLKTLFHA